MLRQIRRYAVAIAAAAMLLAGVHATQQPPPAGPAAFRVTAPDEEFVGPFASWQSATRDYGAMGDGAADDTAALQRALDELGSSGRSPVLYLPAGRYRVTAPLRLSARANVSVVGEHPARVTLVWAGPSGGTMLELNGVAYSRVTRLTFDGRGAASVGIEQAWDNMTGPFDTGNEYSDLVLTDLEHGIRGGFKGYGFAETTIARVRFIRNAEAGVALGNFNALDIWVRDSIFEDCGVGVTNEPGAGNFRVYDSVFRRSRVADLRMQNTGIFSARGNYSAGSRAFFVSDGPFSHPSNIDITHNTIVDPDDSTPIRLGNQGPGFIADNVIRSRDGQGGPAISWRSRAEADVFAIGNTFTVPQPVTSNGRFVSLDERRVPRAILTPSEPVMPDVWPAHERQVIEVAPGADARAIQRAFAAAAARRGERPIVHLPFGIYRIAETLRVPPSDIQIVGDGAATRLVWSGPADGVMLAVEGPSRATFRELAIDGDAQAIGIALGGIDQPDARLYLEGVQFRSGREANLQVDGVEHLTLDVVDSGHAYVSEGTSFLLRAGTTRIWSGASAGNALTYEISGGASLLARDIWYEGTAPRGFARISGRADATFQSVRVATPAGRGPAAFTVNGLDGQVAIVGSHVDDRLAIEGAGERARVLVLGLFREHHDVPFILRPVPPGTELVMLNARQRARTQGLLSPGSVALADEGTRDAVWLRTLLAEARRPSSPPRLTPKADGVSDVRLFRVAIENGRVNMLVGPEPAAGGADGQRPDTPIQ